MAKERDLFKSKANSNKIFMSLYHFVAIFFCGDSLDSHISIYPKRAVCKQKKEDTTKNKKKEIKIKKQKTRESGESGHAPTPNPGHSTVIAQ